MGRPPRLERRRAQQPVGQLAIREPQQLTDLADIELLHGLLQPREQELPRLCRLQILVVGLRRSLLDPSTSTTSSVDHDRVPFGQVPSELSAGNAHSTPPPSLSSFLEIVLINSKLFFDQKFDILECMNGIEKQIEYWRQAGLRGFKTAQDLYKTKHYDACLFFCHLALEKLLKGLVVQNTKQH